MLVTSSVGEFIPGRYEKPGVWTSKVIYELKVDKLKKENTYVLIFGIHNVQQLKALEECKEIKILYKGPPAVNKVSGHGQHPRNTLVIFELK